MGVNEILAFFYCLAQILLNFKEVVMIWKIQLNQINTLKLSQSYNTDLMNVLFTSEVNYNYQLSNCSCSSTTCFVNLLSLNSSGGGLPFILVFITVILFY